MQLNYDSAALTGRTIALPGSHSSPLLRHQRNLTAPNTNLKTTASLLCEAQNDSWEVIVWLSIGICSLSVLILSLV